MSLLAKLRAGTEIKLSPRVALLLAGCKMVGVDGDFNGDEIAIIHLIDGEQRAHAWDQTLDA